MTNGFSCLRVAPCSGMLQRDFVSRSPVFSRLTTTPPTEASASLAKVSPVVTETALGARGATGVAAVSGSTTTAEAL